MNTLGNGLGKFISHPYTQPHIKIPKKDDFTRSIKI